LADRVVVMDHGVIEQIGTPEQVYMQPATPFVAQFVGESNRLPGGLHVRPHDIEICTTGGAALLVDNVFRKGGHWRVEGTLPGSGDVVELDLDASLSAPAVGTTIAIRPRRSTTFSDA